MTLWLLPYFYLLDMDVFVNVWGPGKEGIKCSKAVRPLASLSATSH